MSNAARGALADADALYAQLNQFNDAANIHRHWLEGFRFTEGVRFLSRHARCYWLIDFIARLQVRALEDACLRDFQLWELRVNGGSALLVCSRDSDDAAFREVIEATDFPFGYVRLYVEGGVLLLPSEH